MLENISEFLYDEGFSKNEKTTEGILELINKISDYYEEGIHLYPEVILTDNLRVFDTIPKKVIHIKENDLDIAQFKDAIKLCAPLATNNWVIFIEVKSEKIKFGVISAEMSETSLSIYNQTVGDVEPSTYGNIAYIRNIGQKTVELVGLKKKLIISLTLDDTKSVLNNEINILSINITEKCYEAIRDKAATYFEKTLNEAIKIGHGNLIGIIPDETECIDNLKQNLDDGIYLSEPIDLGQLIKTAEGEKSNESSVALKAYTSILISMLNHDGITVLTDSGKILGYHLFVKQDTSKAKVVGGARTRAFESMKTLNIFNSCFYKSQDGNIKYYSKNE